jgi:hypothetical protein
LIIEASANWRMLFYLLNRIPTAQRLPDARLTTIIKNNEVGQGSGKPGDALR